MIGDIYVLDKNLKQIDVIDSYDSCIWANRYNEVGDCELYLPASTKMLNILQKDNYLIRLNDDMICRINYVKLQTNDEEGDYITVRGIDVKNLLYQRIIWKTMNCDGNLEDFVRKMVEDNAGNPELIARKFLKENGESLLFLGEKSNFEEVATEQVSYRNLGEKIENYCKMCGWGDKIILKDEKLYFLIYKGNDKSNYVIFSEEYESLKSTMYSEDNTNLGNIAVIAGEGEGAARSKEIIGDTESINRYEIFVDARDISKTITWEDLIELYPNGSIINENDSYVYKINSIDIQVIDDNQMIELQEKYPGGSIIIKNNQKYYRIGNIIIADLPNNSPTEFENVILRDVIYSVYLLNRGQEKLSEYGRVTSFEGAIEPDTTFEYKKDYFLGDIVTIENEYGISVEARIVEIIETDDNNGYSVEPKFEYIEEE